jgi:hypothetical protein
MMSYFAASLVGMDFVSRAGTAGFALSARALPGARLGLSPKTWMQVDVVFGIHLR